MLVNTPRFFRFFRFFEGLLGKSLCTIRKIIVQASISISDVGFRDTPFGPVTDSLRVAQKFEMEHKHVLRAIKKCLDDVSVEPKFGLNRNIIENSYLGGAKGKERSNLKYDITEFGVTLLLLYINTPKARLVSAEILYRFFILKTYLSDMSENLIGAIKGHYRKKKEKVAQMP